MAAEVKDELLIEVNCIENYTSQLWSRLHLNSIDSILYRIDDDEKADLEEQFKYMQGYLRILGKRVSRRCGN